MDIITKGDRASKAFPSPYKWKGSKRMLLAVSNFTKYFPPITKMNTYYEMFCGSCVVAFNYLDKYPSQVILNDADGNIQKFWETIQTQQKEFEERLKFRWQGSEEYIEIKDEMDKIIYWYLKQQNTFQFEKPNKMFKQFDAWAEILNKSNVLFTSKKWNESINSAKTINRKTFSVIYCDPPYDETEGYECDFNLEEWAEYMNEKLLHSDHYVFISLNKTDLVMNSFKDWYSIELYTFKANANKERIEMLFSNKKFVDYSDKITQTTIFDF